MSMRDALLADIGEHPEDDGVRLVYADWLEDNGEPARAAFIRTQVTLAKLAEDDPRRDELEDREADLLNAHEEEWLAALPALPDYNYLGPLVRGFVEEATFGSSKDFLSVAEALFAATPLRCLSVGGRNEGHDWLRLPELSRLTELAIRHDIGAEGAWELAGAGHLANLRRLSLDRVADAGALVRSPHFGRVEYLALESTSLGPEEITALLGASGWHGLTSLSLGAWDREDEWLPVLARPEYLGRLTALGLRDMGHAAERIRPLLASPGLAGLKVLDLAGNELGDEIVSALAASPHLANLVELRLSYNHVGPEGVAALAASPHLARLRELSLDHNDLTDEGAEALARAPHLTALRRLDLELCEIKGPGVAALAASPALAGLWSLHLWDNVVGPAGATALASSTHLTGLTELVLTNGIGTEGAKALARSTAFGRLAQLDLSFDDIGDEGARALANSTAFPRLRSLTLLDNGITDEGALALLASPLAGRLRALVLTENDIGEEARQAVRQRLGRRVAL